MPRQRKGMTPARAERAAQVVRLYDSGSTFESIAKHLGISITQARADYDKAMEEARPDTARNVFHKLDRRMNLLHQRYLKKALEGDIQSAKLVLDINRRLMELWGVQGATKLDIEVSSGEGYSAFLEMVRAGKVIVDAHYHEEEDDTLDDLLHS